MDKLDMLEFPPLLPESIIRRAKKLSSANISDGMNALDLPGGGCMEASIMPACISMKVVGTACTVETSDGDNLPVHVALYMAKPGYVMVIDGKGYESRPYFGDLMSSTGRAVGLKGMIVDGMVRDRKEIVENGFPVFCKGYIQRSPMKSKPGKINYPITCGTIPVSPGDLIVADGDGVSVVPRDLIETVLEQAEKKVEYERRRQETIAEYERLRQNQEPLIQLAPQWVLDMTKPC